jgi:hypothetical protein
LPNTSYAEPAGIAQMKFEDTTWTKWTEWIGAIKTDLSNIVNARAVFKEFRDVLEKNDAWIRQNHGDRFCGFVVRGYVIHVVLGVRRHAKTKGESISLARLLDQMRKCAGQVTVDSYVKLLPSEPSTIRWQQATFAAFSRDGKVLSEEIIGADLDKLRQCAGTIESFADKALAHLDSKKFDGELTFGAIHDAIGVCDKLVCRYLGLLKGDGYDTLEASVQYPWTRIFSVPLRPA